MPGGTESAKINLPAQGFARRLSGNKGLIVDITGVASLVGGWRGAPSRRELLRGLAGAGLALGMARFSGGVAAKKRRHHGKKRKRAKLNAFGCLEVGDDCTSAAGCCSGICEGKKGKRRCRAHGTGICDQQGDGLCEAVNPKLTACDNSGKCACFHTTAGSNFCANTFVETACADCRKDADCEKLGFPAGSACLPFSRGNCVASCETGMACLPPCGVGGVSGAG